MAQITQTLSGKSWHLLLYKLMRFCFRNEVSTTPTQCGYWLIVGLGIPFGLLLICMLPFALALAACFAAGLVYLWLLMLLLGGMLITRKQQPLVLKFRFKGKRYPVAFLTMPLWTMIFFGEMAYAQPEQFPWFFGGFLLVAAFIGGIFAWDKWITPNCSRYEIT